MVKNSSGQKIGAQMVSATDGSAFTGSVTVSVTVDAGTQATGSVGSGACTHEGNGYHTYAPAQAETNGTLLAFTFTGTGAIPVTVQVFTTGFDPTAAVVPANVTQFGGSNGTFASGRPEVNTTHVAGTSQTAGDIIADTNDIQTRLPAALVAGRMDASVGAMAADVLTSTAVAASAVTEIQSGLSTLDAAGVRTAIGLASANLDTQLTAIDDYLDTEVAAIKAKTDQLVFTTANKVDARAFTVDDKTGYSLATGGVISGAIASAELNAIADAVLDRNMATGTDSGADNTTTRTVRQALRRLRNKEAISAGTGTVYKENDSTASWTYAATTTAGDPLSSVDPT